MTNTDPKYPSKKNDQLLIPFFLGISWEVFRDSLWVYISISFISILSTIYAILVTTHVTTLSGILLLYLVEKTNGIFLLIPPFVLTVVVMFPSFSDRTKSTLALKIDKGDQPLGAPFLNEFVSIVFWSLIMLLHNLISLGLIQIFESTQSDWIGYTIDLMTGMWIFIFLSLSYAILYSLKLLYMLILREYYD